MLKYDEHETRRLDVDLDDHRILKTRICNDFLVFFILLGRDWKRKNRTGQNEMRCKKAQMQDMPKMLR